MDRHIPLRRNWPFYLFIVVILCFLSSSRNFAFSQNETLVVTQSGPITGLVQDDLRLYLGIPYAAPPVGELRWKPPQPVTPWTDARPCEAYGPIAPQSGVLLDLLQESKTMSEDCLYLNVVTPAQSSSERLPVLVWIHSGGFHSGYGEMIIQNGLAFAKQGIVVCFFNYRLGALGFLAHPLLSAESEHGVSGNYGLLDQIAALRWVRDNIAALGGDPQNVTIAGESSGASSVTTLMINPLAQGLFHKAISESGTVLSNPMIFLNSPGDLESAFLTGENLADALGCAQGDVLANLRAIPAAQLVEVQDDLNSIVPTRLQFGPVNDGYVIPENPLKSYAEGDFTPLPLLIGSNADEYSMFVENLTQNEYVEWVHGVFPTRAEAILAAFPSTSDEEVMPSLDSLYTISTFIHPARFIARSLADADLPVYLYQFTRKAPILDCLLYGCYHGFEISYVFGSLPVDQGYIEEDFQLSERMTLYWSQFIKTGDPNGSGLPEWPRYDSTEDRHLILDAEISIGEGLEREACDLFDSFLETSFSAIPSLIYQSYDR